VKHVLRHDGADVVNGSDVTATTSFTVHSSQFTALVPSPHDIDLASSEISADISSRIVDGGGES